MRFLPQPGVYRHYKGGTYTVLFQAHDSTNERLDGAMLWGDPAEAPQAGVRDSYSLPEDSPGRDLVV